MRHCNDANDVGDVVWFDPSVGGSGLILEVYSRKDMEYETYTDIALGSRFSPEHSVAELLLELQRRAR